MTPRPGSRPTLWKPLIPPTGHVFKTCSPPVLSMRRPALDGAFLDPMLMLNFARGGSKLFPMSREYRQIRGIRRHCCAGDHVDRDA